MKISPSDIISSLGQLLSYYETDLNYIKSFYRFKNNEIDGEKYIDKKNKSGFKNFLDEYRVTRNVKKSEIEHLMNFTKEWVLDSSNDTLDVDKFAQELKNKKITHDNKVMTSLSSKILFLNNPEAILPIDSFNKRALGEKTNTYSNFKPRVDTFISNNTELINDSLNKISPLLSDIEVAFSDLGINFCTYRRNRYSDKLLWVKGSH